MVVECASDGSDVDVARVLAGRAVVLNLWAYWCAPCAQELPALAEYQRRVGDAVTVVTVHQDENEAAALSRLAELGVRLPTLQDASRRIAPRCGFPMSCPRPSFCVRTVALPRSCRGHSPASTISPPPPGRMPCGDKSEARGE